MVLTLLYILFVFSSIVLIVVILLQEGRGGGFGEVLGGAGQATFGVGASGINKFTAWTAAVFLGSAILISIASRTQAGASVLDEGGASRVEAPAEPSEGE